LATSSHDGLVSGSDDRSRGSRLAGVFATAELSGIALAPQTNEIMNMDVIAGTHGLTECPNHLTIFSDMVTCRQIAKRDLVAERQRLAKAEQNRLSALAHRHDRILA
jgi:hypothetical protein